MYDIGKQIAKLIRQMESGEIKVGDIVYCSKILSNIILIELPDQEFFIQYHKDKLDIRYPPFSEHIKYKTLNGKIDTCSIACIAKISKGNYSASYEIKKKGKDAKELAEYIKYLALSDGFRVEKKRTKIGFILKFFGVSQYKLNKFVKI